MRDVAYTTLYLRQPSISIEPLGVLLRDLERLWADLFHLREAATAGHAGEVAKQSLLVRRTITETREARRAYEAAGG